MRKCLPLPGGGGADCELPRRYRPEALSIESRLSWGRVPDCEEGVATTRCVMGIAVGDGVKTFVVHVAQPAIKIRIKKKKARLSPGGGGGYEVVAHSAPSENSSCRSVDNSGLYWGARSVAIPAPTSAGQPRKRVTLNNRASGLARPEGVHATEGFSKMCGPMMAEPIEILDDPPVRGMHRSAEEFIPLGRPADGRAVEYR